MMERTPALEQLIEVARGITANHRWRPGAEITLEDTGPIAQFMAGLTPEALGLVPHAHAYISPAATLPGDIRYLHIAQEAEFSIGVFVLPPGACIPLHDHPNMCVISHVLYGSVKITCYDRLEDNGSGSAARRRAAWPGQPHLATLRGCAWHCAPHTSRLTSSIANVHELEAGGDGTAILDVLIPPYDEGAGRDCTYYRPEANEAAGVRLVPCSPGNHFRVVRGDFVPPFPM